MGDQNCQLDSSLFLPLKGHEQISRLDEKFAHFFDSESGDDDDDSRETPTGSKSRGKVSQWKPSPSPKDIKWLQSPSKTLQGSRKCVVAAGGQAKLRTPRKNKRNVSTKQKTDKHSDKCQPGESVPHGHRFAKKQVKPHIEEFDSDEEDMDHVLTVTAGQDLTQKNLTADKETEPQRSDTSNTTYLRKRCRNIDTTAVKDSPKTPKTNDNEANHNAPGFESQLVNVWAEFSELEAVRPSLQVEPVAAKVDFILSEDGAEPRVAVPALINQYLRDYQRDGIRFLYSHYMKGRGAILGDDMGLGKTIQVIGFLAALLGKTGKQIDTLQAVPNFIKQISNDFPDTPPKKATCPFLIIGPTAVLFNWLDELETWGYFTAGKYHGADKDTCLSDVKKGKLEVVVTTFETYRDKVELLNQIEWEAVIVDEVHKIKGLKAQVTQALRIIKTQCRFGLTGTALQNNMTELYSLLDWAQPRVLGNLEQFETEFVRVIEKGQKHDATNRELAVARKQRDRFAKIRKNMLLRRTKALIADQLPHKEEMVVMCHLSELQINVYQAILDHPDMKLVLLAEDPCDCGKGKQRASCCYKRRADGTKVWGLVFSFMHLMLKAANHVGLLIPDNYNSSTDTSRSCLNDANDGHGGQGESTEDEKPGVALARSVFRIAFRDQPQFVELTRVAAFRTLSDPRYCGKMKILQGLLRVFEKNHDKVLIFSYSTKLLDIIEHYVISQGHEYSRIDGKVSGQKRRDIVHKFNSEPSIFICLISTKAGGLGLNLTGANRVVIFDPNWNPSHDLQAQDRAYRIGQTRDVKVFRLVSAGTIEENIYLRQIYKQQLDEVAVSSINARRYFHGIQGDKTNRGELFGIKNMFTLRTGGVCLTMDILKRNERLEQGLTGFDITEYIPPKKDTDAETESDEAEAGVCLGKDQSEADDPNIDRADEEENDEDEDFLRDIFGIDQIRLDPGASTSSTVIATNKNTREEDIKLSISRLDTAGGCESDEEEEEFSLIPNIRHSSSRQKVITSTEDATDSEALNISKRHLNQSTSHYNSNKRPSSSAGGINNHLSSPSQVHWGSDIHEQSTTMDPDESYSASNALDDLFSMSDITFTARRTCDKTFYSSGLDIPPQQDVYEDVLEEKADNEKGLTSNKSGISWLFSDSDDNFDDAVNSRDDFSNEKAKSKNISPSKKNIQLKQSHTGEIVDGKEHNIGRSTESKDRSPTSASAGKIKLQKKSAAVSERKVRIDPESSRKSSHKRSTKTKATFSTEQSLLANSDVLYTHTNTGVLGASRAEDHMTRCAIKAVYEERANTQAPALACDPLTQPEEEEIKEKAQQVTKENKQDKESYNRRQCLKAGSYKLLVGQTPPAIARKQWSDLSAKHGLSELDLARYVLKASVGDRLNMLKDFYQQKHPAKAVGETLSNLFSLVSDKESSKNQATSVTGKYKQGSDTSASSSKAQIIEPLKQETPKSHSDNIARNKTKSVTSPTKRRTSPKPCCSKTLSPFFLEASTLASDSQESITARPPRRRTKDTDSDSDNKNRDVFQSQDYQPVSYKKVTKTSPVKKSPYKLKSQYRTKLRYKTGFADHDNATKSSLKDGPVEDITSDINFASNSLTSGMYQGEDIPSLLCEMGQHDRTNEWERSPNKTQHSRKESKIKEIVFVDENSSSPSKLLDHMANQDKTKTHQNIASSSDSHSNLRPNEISASRKNITPSRNKKPVSILDDIFGENASIVSVESHSISLGQINGGNKEDKIQFGYQAHKVKYDEDVDSTNNNNMRINNTKTALDSAHRNSNEEQMSPLTKS